MQCTNLKIFHIRIWRQNSAVLVVIVANRCRCLILGRQKGLLRPALNQQAGSRLNFQFFDNISDMTCFTIIKM